MSRNKDTGISMHNKSRSHHTNNSSGGRPKAITQVTSIAACEKWRSQVVRETSQKVEKINDPAATDYQLRELNDEINKLQREKWMWESQLKNLGGTNYMRFQGNLTDAEGRVVGSHKGYKYYGRAKELPGVKELFSELKAPPKQSLTHTELYKLDLDAAYFGFRDEEDPKLLAYEAQREAEARNNLQHDEDRRSRWDMVNIPEPEDLPTNAEIEAVLLEKRKAALLSQYS
ncbi:Isy1-like splicing factor [Protomyces lactucae-debilis]|uniref:Isy1-like splicing factor n=1 Tax=Protomyces lactucae-debilis TaxID=2754530 RepID=A0A1Y2FQ43_PROLT|nr:Isy1-like splicing factor [Protomyces lactucae-debilis]ORY86110.1 Isy1-like splicing factor [Protomyces lactucae-debilis]